MTAFTDFRKRYPQYDDMSDKELADAFHSKYYSDIPIDDYYSQIGLDTDVDFFDATGEALKRTAGSFVTGTTGAFLGLGQLTPFDEEALDIQESIEAGTRDFLGYDPAYDDSTAAQVGEVAGTIGSFLVPGALAGKILNAGKVAKTSIAAGQGAGFGLTTGAKEREAAEERGIDISEGQEALAKLSDAGIGSLEAFGLPFRVFRGLPKGFFKSEVGKGFQDRIESMIAGGLQEGIQEAGAGIARDIAALNIYDPDRQVADSAIEDFTVGGIAGGVLDLALGAFGKKVPTINEAVRQADLAKEEQVREAQEEYEAGVRARETGRKQRAEQVDQLLAETREEAMEGVERSPLDIAIDYRRTSGSDIPRAELEFKSGSPLDDVQYNSILGQAQEAEAAPILALPSPDSRKLAAQKAVEERLKKLGLSDRVVARVVDSVFPRAILDEAGNITYEVDARDPVATEYGAYQPVSKVIQLSVDQVFSDARGEPVTEEMLVNSIIGTLNHEVYHALRNLDVVTQEEVTLLEKLARKYQKAGTKDTDGKPQSYAAWANSTYVKRNEDGDLIPDLDPVRMAEESVAEMISDALAGKLMLDGKPVTLGGKPRNIIQKIVGFFKEMVGFTSEADARNFSDFLTKLEAGEIGGRQPEIRTPYLVERGRAKAEFERKQEQEKGLGKQAISDKPIVEQEERLEDEEEGALQSLRGPAYKDEVGRSVARETFVKEIEDSGLEAGAYVGEFEIDELNLTPPAKRLMRALERDDYLGFDRVDDLFVQLFDETGLEGYDASPQLKSAVGRYVNEMSGMTGFDRPLYSRRVGRPDTGVRPEVGRAYQQFQAGEINRDKYDSIVRGTVSEYDFVPQPATEQEMFGALDKNKKEKINLPIEEATEVGLRLDIPAYTNHGVWVPTIHAKGKASHRATAAINNADFTRTSQAKAQRVMEGGAKSPFAQIKGNFVSRTDAENEAIAQQALSDPAWTQVGFDPRRHSYFYDRKTGEAVTTAEEVVQVGPLVLAKNAVKDPAFQEETLYSKRYTGAPAGLETPQKLGGLRRIIKGLAQEGEPGRFWYERSGKALLDITGGDKEKAKRLAQAIAITSPQTPVPTNFDYAVQAYYQHEAGQPIKTGMFPTDMADKLEEVFSGKDWEGRKTNNFYNNVMRSIDPTIAQGVTTDLWMMRAFGYRGDAPTDAQYTFVEEETKRLADELGWEPQQVQAAIWVAMKARTEAKPVRKETERISERLGYMTYVPKPGTKKLERKILDEDGHRSVWLGQALKYDPTRAEKESSKFDFEDAAKNNLAQISWESIPGRTTGHMPQVFDADYSVLQNYHVDISKAFLDADGNDIVARELGILSPGDFEAPGHFEGRVSPGTQTQIVAPKKYKSLSLADIDSLERKGEITADEAKQMRAERIEPSAEDLMAAYAAVRGILMKQDMVGYHKPFTNKSLRKKDLNGFDIDIGRPLSEKETARLAELLADASGHSEYNPIASDTGARLINFDYLDVSNNDFNNIVVKSLARMEFDNGESFSANRFAASAKAIGNDWSVDKNGEGYIRDIERRSPDLSGRVRDLVGQLQPRIQAVDQEYAGKYGWAVNPDINRTFADSGTGRANTANYAGTVEGALLRDGRLLVSHFAGQKRPTLDPSKAGTGADRTKRNRPTSAVWVGVTKAKTDPYVRESLLGPVESQYAINLADVYVVSDLSNPLAKPDPEGMWTRYPAGGDVNYDEILRKVRKKGYKGFLINSPQHGKLILWSEPLNILDEQMQSRRTPTQEPLITRKRNPAKLEQAVLKDEILAEESQGFPRVSFVADPEAQYVAQNPDSGYTPRFEEEQLRSRRPPDRSPSYQSAMNDAVGERETGPSQLETYMEATGEGKFSYWLTKFKQGAVNRYARLEALNKDPALRDNLADSSSIAAALFADRSRGVVASAIKYGVPVYRNGITKVENFTHNNKQYRGLVDLMSMLYSKEHGDLTKDAQAYAIAKRGGKLTQRTKNGKPVKAPLTPAQREEIEKNAEAYLDAKGNSIIKEWYSAWQAYNDYTIRFLRDTGVLDAETAQLWRDGADYIPFYRAAGGEKGAPVLAQRVFSGDLTSKAYIKEYKGSEEAIDVPLMEAIGLNLTAAIEMGMRNVAQQRIARDMQRLGLAKQLKKNEQPEGTPVTFKVDGKEVRFDIYDPLISASMESVPEMSGVVTSVFAKPATFLREMVTRDPGFMAVNMLRDTLSTFVTSGSNFVPVVDTLRGVSQGIETLERSGVVGGYDYSNDPDDVTKFYKKEMKRRGIGPEGGRGSPLGMINTIWDWAGDATTKSDAATRNAVYNDVLARTGNEAEAHFQALEVINFSRRGANPLVRVLTATIPFLNARFQGLDVFWRAGFGRYSANSELNRRQAMQSFYTRAGMLAGLTGLYYLLVSDNDQYKEQSEHIRDNNWILPTPSGVPVKIPIPFEVGLVFKTLPETFLATRYGDKSSKEARETIQRGVVSTLEVNILGIQAISPLVEASMNHSFYTGRDIVPYYMDANVATGLQDRVGTSQIAKFVGAELGISPIKIDHVLNGYGGTIGSYVLAGVDTMLRSKAITGDDAAKMPALRAYEYPLMKRFFASKEGSGLREDAYDLYREINKIVTTSNKLRKEGRMDELEAYLGSRQHILALKSPVYSAKKRLDVVRKQRDAILRADMDAERKREMIDDLDAELNEYLKIIPDLKKRADLPAFESRFMQRLTGS